MGFFLIPLFAFLSRSNGAELFEFVIIIAFSSYTTWSTHKSTVDRYYKSVHYENTGEAFETSMYWFKLFQIFLMKAIGWSVLFWVLCEVVFKV